MERRHRLLAALALAAACLIIYLPSLHFAYLNYDDIGYITDNKWVLGGLNAAGLRWAMTNIDYFFWQPLAWISHQADVQFFGLNPAVPRLENILLHIANALLVFAILLRLSGMYWRSVMATALFALHPLRVESVVWVAERKDVLCAFFFLASILLYLRYVERPSRSGYYLVIAAFVLGIASKPMGLTLPVVLLLLDWWPLKRRALAEKLPLFAIAGISGLLTSISTARLGSINWGTTVNFSQRLANTLVSYQKYLELTFWPRDLCILYPFPWSVPLSRQVTAALLLVAITAFAVWQRKRRPYLLMGWLWFMLVLLPPSGLLMQSGRQGMADRFTYLPHVGLAIAVVWGVAEAAGKRGVQGAATLGILFLAIFAARTSAYIPLWRDSVTVFQNAVAVTWGNPAAHHFLGAALQAAGREDEALPHFAEAVRLEPGYFVAHTTLGAALARRGRREEAIEHFRAALRAFPGFPDAERLLEENEKLLDLSKASGSKLKSEQ